MATSSEVKAGLDEISTMIKASRQKMVASKERVSAQEISLNSIPTVYSDVLDTVNSYGTDDIFEALCKAELAKMTSEFMALVADINLAVADLANRTEF